ncbi:LysR substrate binding domain-containing protein [Amycolatopsis xylanica]|uniref:LysR substrate binding domain-containing protein n=1 Tax=Amycolatopsis xylanica TaxID=589385 RepID=A0A1H3M4B4_9PSEU|nr:LysR substrate binding domain-containing protein [Amycolatopsis xylanica]
MTRLETRELAYFVAVAEELHFGRAAQRLGMAQPPLSRAIRQLERRLGVILLERSSRKVSLTPAGEVLLVEGRAVLASVEAAARRAKRAGQSERRLLLVMRPGADFGLLPRILAAYEQEAGALPVEVVYNGHEGEAMVRDGSADVALLSPHHDLAGLDSEDLIAEDQTVVIAWSEQARSQAVAALVGAALRVAAREMIVT